MDDHGRSDRRRFLTGAAALGASTMLGVSADAEAATTSSAVSSSVALQRLHDGNARFVSGASQHPNQTAEARQALVSGQAPFAALLSCVDSRVPPELVFDTGLGELFVARTAGQVIDEAVIGSLEYAVSALGVRLIMVLGHSGCGA